MHRYPELNSLENVLMEVYTGGSILSEDVAILLNVSQSTGSNILRKCLTRGFLNRKNINKHQKFGQHKYEYNLNPTGQKRVIWIRENKLS